MRGDPRPAAPAPVRLHQWVVAGAAAVLTLVALVAGSGYGDVRATHLHARLVAWVSAAVVLVAGVVATSRLSSMLGRTTAIRSVPAVGGAVRVLSAAVGYLFVVFAVLSVLAVSIGHLLIGAGLAGVVLGIAAQQSLGNVFAGFVLVLARPFDIGDRIRIRSGALGGIFDASVLDMSLTYVGLETEEGELKVPNSAMLAAGICRLPSRVEGG